LALRKEGEMGVEMKGGKRKDKCCLGISREKKGPWKS
jgi:hypothetical protein